MGFETKLAARHKRLICRRFSGLPTGLSDAQWTTLVDHASDLALASCAEPLIPFGSGS
jgi:hypothetical protein